MFAFLSRGDMASAFVGRSLVRIDSAALVEAAAHAFKDIRRRQRLGPVGAIPGLSSRIDAELAHEAASFEGLGTVAPRDRRAAGTGRRRARTRDPPTRGRREARPPPQLGEMVPQRLTMRTGAEATHIQDPRGPQPSPSRAPRGSSIAPEDHVHAAAVSPRTAARLILVGSSASAAIASALTDVPRVAEDRKAMEGSAPSKARGSRWRKRGSTRRSRPRRERPCCPSAA